MICVPFENVAADVFIVAADGGIDICNRYAKLHQLFRRHDHLILLEIAAEGVDFVYSGNTFQLRCNNPLLNGSKVRQVSNFLLRITWHLSFKRILVNLSHGGANRPHSDRNALWNLLPSLRQPFEDQLPGKVDVNIILENNGDNREAKLGD